MKQTRIKHTTKGRIAELKIASKLMEKGFEVFMSLNDTFGTDLIIRKDCGIATVQVKSFSIRKGGIIYSSGIRQGRSYEVDLFIFLIGDDYYLIDGDDISPLKNGYRQVSVNTSSISPSNWELALSVLRFPK